MRAPITVYTRCANSLLDVRLALTMKKKGQKQKNEKRKKEKNPESAVYDRFTVCFICATLLTRYSSIFRVDSTMIYKW